MAKKCEKRFFLFTYNYPSGHGNLNVWTDNNEFPQNKFLKETMSKNANCQPHEIVVTGWNEFKNEADYNAFNE